LRGLRRSANVHFSASPPNAICANGLGYDTHGLMADPVGLRLINRGSGAAAVWFSVDGIPRQTTYSRSDMSKFTHKIKEEALAMIPPMIFFFVALNIVALIRALMLHGTGIQLSTPVQILIAALVLAKAVLIADMLPLINRYPDEPLIYNVTWKTLIYLLIATGMHYLERLIDFWKEAGSFVAANHKLLEVMVWPHFVAIKLVLFVLILNYCVVTELSRVMGAKKLSNIFFHKPVAAH
jgi:hypothetical protein